MSKKKLILSIAETIVGGGMIIGFFVMLANGIGSGAWALLLLPAFLLLVFGIWGIKGYREKKKAPVIVEDDDIKFNIQL